MVAGAFLLVMAGFGAIYSYAAFAEQIAADFGTDLVGVSFIYALSGASCFFVSAVSGPLADRVGPRLPATAGTALVGLGLLVAAAAGSLAEIYAGYGLLIGIGTGFAYVPAMAAVQRCFSAHRGLASGIAASGIGVGTALVPPAAQAFLAVVDWRATFAIFGIAALLVGAVGAMLLEPAGRRGPRRGRAARAADESPFTWRRRAFAATWVGTLLISMPATLPQAMLAGTARDLGLPRDEALGLLGLIGLGSIAGRFVIAAVSDSIGRRRTFLGCCAGMAGSLGLWAAAEGAATLQAFALIFGALQGGFVALLPAFGADSFGVRAAGRVLGLLYTSRGVALLLAPPALAAAAGVAGHAAPVLAAAILGGLGTLLVARAGRPSVPEAENAEGPGGCPPGPSHRVAGARPAEPW
ncbi:OFA family MFS transporter [Roseomonas sp. JC162]|uniref:OFA family MFS transporter n=1 Tax=Neoroseomonas marina TaxID=1232220 RepID=A0A848EEI4_9PROT|nr:OFA family MFS transporter [Neoroseomonas marina]